MAANRPFGRNPLAERWNTSSDDPGVSKRTMPALLFRCPVTRLHVQSWVADDDMDAVQPIQCHACQRIHLVDPKTEKVVGTDEKD